MFFCRRHKFIFLILCIFAVVLVLILYTKHEKNHDKKQNKIHPRHLEGRIVFQSNISGNKEIYVADIGSKNIKRLTNTSSDNLYPNWSPDAKKIVFYSNREGNNEIYIMDSDGRNQKKLTDNKSDDISPSWHPDGEKIIFVSDRDGAMNFYFMDKKGEDVEKITNFKDGVHDMPRLSCDGREVLFTSNMSLGWQVFRMDINSGKIERASDLLSGHCEGIWSNNGSNIAYVSRLGNGNSAICLAHKDGRGTEKLNSYESLDYNPRFSPGDDKIMFTSERDGGWDIYVTDLKDKTTFKAISTDGKDEWPDWTTR